MALPRGFRNNNPGNLIISDSQWLGKIPMTQNTDGELEQFTTVIYGIRAMMLDILNDIMIDGMHNVHELITEYAGVSNQNYINHIAEGINVTPFQVVPFSESVFKTMIYDMIYFENQMNATNAQINEAYNMLSRNDKLYLDNFEVVENVRSKSKWVFPILLVGAGAGAVYYITKKKKKK